MKNTARFIIGLSMAVPLHALDSKTRLVDFVHTAWKAGEHPFSSVYSLAQTTDGALWLATPQGVYRFDGVRFTLFEPLSSSAIHRLLATRDGSLWGIYSAGNAIVRLAGGKVTAFPLPAGAMAEADDGSVIVTVPKGMVRFHNGQWVDLAGPSHPETSRYQGLWTGRNGALWLVTLDKFYKRAPGRDEFLDAGSPVRPRYLPGIQAEAPDGTMWFAGAEVTRSVPDGRAGTELNVKANFLRFDREGSLWVGTSDLGLLRIREPALVDGKRLAEREIERYSPGDGLTGNRVWSVLEDREGNIWVGTNGGLDRFRRGAFHRIGIPNPGNIDEVLSLNDGGVLLRRRDQPALQRLGPNGQSIALPMGRTPVSFYHSAKNVTCMDTNGDIWLGTTAGVGRLTNDGVFYPPQPRLREIDQVDCRDGDVWIGDRALGIHRLLDGKVVSVPGFAGRTYRIFVESRGKVWVTRYEGILISYDHGVIREYGKKDGLASGVPANIFRTPKGDLWLVSEHGLTRINHGRFRSANVIPGVLLRWGAATTDAAWFRGGVHLLKLNLWELDRAVDDPAYRPAIKRLGALDGLPPTVGAFEPSGSQIWIVSSDRFGYMAEDQLRPNPLPPPLQIESFTVDGNRLPASTGVELPKLIHNLQIDYTAFSLTIPERVLFEYKLDGVDEHWQKAGTRRQAYYTDLAPRNYRFHVRACNNDGVWSEAPTSVAFAVAPAYYQTNWFKSAYILALVAGGWGIHRVRLRQITNKYNLRLEERVRERTRIARELHDTLLQSFQGLVLRLQAVGDQLPESGVKNQLESALERADQAIAEGRNAIHDLRSASERDLKGAIEAMAAEELGTAVSPAFRIVVEGTVKEIHPLICDEVCAVAREALRNAICHANASIVETKITYGSRSLRARIRDDGQGIPCEFLERPRPGHYGLSGLRERAKLMGAKLEIRSRQGEGTQVDLDVPCAVAYRNSPRRLRFPAFAKGRRVCD